jgi:hypothetical protein
MEKRRTFFVIVKDPSPKYGLSNPDQLADQVILSLGVSIFHGFETFLWPVFRWYFMVTAVFTTN